MFATGKIMLSCCFPHLGVPLLKNVFVLVEVGSESEALLLKMYIREDTFASAACRWSITEPGAVLYYITGSVWSGKCILSVCLI